jgi:hypothetical protein
VLNQDLFIYPIIPLQCKYDFLIHKFHIFWGTLYIIGVCIGSLLIDAINQSHRHLYAMIYNTIIDL